MSTKLAMFPGWEGQSECQSEHHCCLWWHVCERRPIVQPSLSIMASWIAWNIYKVWNFLTQECPDDYAYRILPSLYAGVPSTIERMKKDWLQLSSSWPPTMLKPKLPDVLLRNTMSLQLYRCLRGTNSPSYLAYHTQSHLSSFWPQDMSGGKRP